MKTLTKSKFTNTLRIVSMALIGILAGFVNGFLGTGGGIILMTALALLPKRSGITARDKFATLIAIILPLSLISAFMYGSSATLADAAQYIPAGILGGIVGAYLLDRLRVGIIKKLFALMVIWAGINFIG